MPLCYKALSFGLYLTTCILFGCEVTLKSGTNQYKAIKVKFIARGNNFDREEVWPYKLNTTKKW